MPSETARLWAACISAINRRASESSARPRMKFDIAGAASDVMIDQQRQNENQFDEREGAILECGGKRSATPLSEAARPCEKRCSRFALPPQSKIFNSHIHSSTNYGIQLPMSSSVPSLPSGPTESKS